MMYVLNVRSLLFQGSVELKMDQEPLSLYDDLSRHTHLPLYKWVSLLIRHGDKVFHSDYNINVETTAFSRRLVEVAARTSQHTVNVNTVPADLNAQVHETFRVIQKLVREYNIRMRPPELLAVTCAHPEAFHGALPKIDLSSVTKNDVRLCVDATEALTATENIILVLDNALSVEVNGFQTVITIPSSELGDCIDELTLYTCTIPYITQAYSVLKSMPLQSLHMTELQAAIEGTEVYVLEDCKTSLEQGEQVQLKYHAFPTYAAHRQMTFISSNPAVLECMNDVVIAKQPGKSELHFLKPDGTHLESRTFTVESFTYTQNIKIVAPFNALGVGETNHIQIFTYPENAIDEKDLSIQITDPTIALVKKNGDVVAFKEGQCVLTVSTKRVSTEHTIEVKPILRQLHVKPSSLSLIRLQKSSIQLGIAPANSVVGELEWDVDRPDIAIIRPFNNSRECEVEAVGEGSCTITCKETKTGIGISCTVQVQKEETAPALQTLSILFTIFGMIGSFMIPLMAGVMHGFGGALVGVLADFWLPLALILAMNGKRKTGGRVKAFQTCITLCLVTLVIMLLIGMCVR